MKRLLLLVPALALVTSVNAFAEFRQIDLSIYGME